MSDPSIYVVGWICALMTEYVAAQEFLDEQHEGPTFVSSNDTNDYTLGRIGQHNVVIAALPDGEYGIAIAANVATNMLNSFPNIRIGLMVGIGGGVRSEKHDIRLGDVVVSASRDNEGGVFQYDFGKAIQGQGFQNTRFLNQPPTTLRTAITGIRAQYERQGHQLERAIQRILEKNLRLRRKYQKPQPSTDRLFQPKAIHIYADCASCADDPSKLVLRAERGSDEDNPAIHYGLIASGNGLIKDALIRDQLAEEKNVLCFEMEAAGLVNTFPCLVIRGICDYSDSHKNDEWQGYAAMVAAAYAKDLLGRISPSRIESETRIKNFLSGLQTIVEDHRNIAQMQLELQYNSVERRLTEKQEECLQLLRLTIGTNDATYEWYKDYAGHRVDGTCEWFLKHTHFQRWLEQESGLLLVSADPGCGKSVLARYLIDTILPQSSTICYFFFNDQDQNTLRQALCALLHQLFSQKPSLIEHAMEYFKTDGPQLIKSTIRLWKILVNALKDSQVGPVIIVLDALDECVESEFENLMQNLKRSSLQSDLGKIKFLFTSRPYEQIINEFRGLLHASPYIHISGEENSDKIGQEVSHFIQHQVKQLAEKKGLSEPVKNHLAKRLLRFTHRTYLWVYLVFDHLKATPFKKTSRGIDTTISALPANLNEAYDQILSKSKEPEMARRALSIILAATRPLTISEMNIALNINGTINCLCDLDLEGREDFKERLRSICGLFVLIHHDKIYFLHRTAREFLLVDTVSPVPNDSGLRLPWQHSITSQSAHSVLAEICVIYLDLLNKDDSSQELKGKRREEDHLLELEALLGYAAINWGMHARVACIGADSDLIAPISNICSSYSRISSFWPKDHWDTRWGGPSGGFNDLLVTSFFGIEAVVKAQLENGCETELKDDNGRTSLSWASERGHEMIVKMLLEKGAVFDTQDGCGRTPLLWAAESGHEMIIQVLLERGATLNSRDFLLQTPISWAIRNGQETLVKLLLEKGAIFESKDIFGRNLLSWAAEKGLEISVKLLIEKGATIDSKNSIGRTPLSFAAEDGHETIVKLLLENGAAIESQDDYGRTPLSWATENGHKKIIKLLLECDTLFDSKDHIQQHPVSSTQEQKQKGNIKICLLEEPIIFKSKDDFSQSQSRLLQDTAMHYKQPVKLLPFQKVAAFESKDHLQYVTMSGEDTMMLLLKEEDIFDSQDIFGQTLLSKAAGYGYKAIVKLLIEKGATLDTQNDFGRTPLSFAAEEGHEAIVKMLLERGATFESKDSGGQDPLSWAAEKGHEAIVKLLLEKGASFESKDSVGYTPMSWAAGNGCEAIVKLLLERGATFESKDSVGRTPISWAAGNGCEAIVKLLLERGATFESKDSVGRTPMSWAAGNGCEEIVKLLLERGATFESNDSGGRTPMSWAAGNGCEAIVKLLLERGATFESNDSGGRTPISWAAENGRKAIVKLLLNRDAIFDYEDIFGLSPLFWAAKNGREAIVRLLIEKGASFDFKDNSGQNPLFWAAKSGHEATVKLLLEKGATFESRDSYGRTPLSWAKRNGHKRIVKLLLEECVTTDSREHHSR
ncbi:hypothetical protein N7540_012739 [Penicillium herquei]|nr:hypothetical protein N7540_012739 [Penicillium herquei]